MTKTHPDLRNGAGHREFPCQRLLVPAAQQTLYSDSAFIPTAQRTFKSKLEEAKMVKTLLLTAALSGLLISDTLSQSTNGGGADASAKFVPSQSTDQLVFSKFKGTDVVGPNDENIGGVNDLLFDKSGKILGVVVGVGGFLGIGQKNVAMDMSAFQLVPAGSSGGPITGGRPAPAAGSGSDDPTKVKLKVAWTKDQVQQAPDFQYFKPPSDAGATTGMGGQRSSPMSPMSPPVRGQ
jgi:hypothetical protein